MSQSRKEKLNEIINDLRNIEERLEKIEQDIENPNNLLLIGAPIRLLINILDDLNKFRETIWNNSMSSGIPVLVGRLQNDVSHAIPTATVHIPNHIKTQHLS